MLKKQLCLGLCVFILFSMVSMMLVQAADANSKLSASYVKFSATQGGDALTNFPFPDTSVYASVEVTNSDTEAKPAVFWVGVYQNDVLVDVEYQYQSVPAATTIPFAAPAIEIKEGYSNDTTEIIAYVWNSFSKANPIVTSANMHRDTPDLKNIYINGTALSGFSSDVTDYTYRHLSSAGIPVITATTKDNATKYEISDFTFPGFATVTATASNGDVKYYNLNLKIHGNIVSLTKNPNAPVQTALQSGEIFDPYTSYFYTDRPTFSIGYAPQSMLGSTIIRMPLGDVRTTNASQLAFMNSTSPLKDETDPKKDAYYYSFRTDTQGTIYAFAAADKPNYSTANGWTKVNSGTVFSPVEYNGRTYTEYNKYNGGPGSVPLADWLPKETLTTGPLGVIRWQPNEPTPYVTLHRHVYKKQFNANEDVLVPVTQNASSSGDGVLYMITWGAE